MWAEKMALLILPKG